MTIDSQPQNRPVWEAESTHPDLALKFTDAMREIIDPEIGMNIIQLGLIRNLKINDEDAQVNMILTTPFCPYGPAMLDSTKKKAEESLERPVYINLGMEVWDFSMMEEGVGEDWGLY